eukprot:386612_1
MTQITMCLTKESVFEQHQEQLRQGFSNDESMNEIVTILGGIDQILSNYLQDKSINLEEMTLQELQTIITDQDTRRATTIIPKRSPTYIVEKKDIGNIQNLDVQLPLETQNNFLFASLSLTHYHHAMNFIHSKFSKASVIITFAIWFVLVATKITLLWSIYIIVISIIFWVPYCILYILSANKTAFRYVFHSFDFWIKFVYLFIWGVCELSHRFILQKNNYNSTAEHVLSIFAYFFFDTVCIFAMVIISSFDGFPSKQIWTIMLPGCISVVTIVYSIYYQFQRATGDDSMVSITDDLQFSLRGIMANAQRVIGIFYAKQTYFAWKGKRATSINIKPTLQWILPDDPNDKNAATKKGADRTQTLYS